MTPFSSPGFDSPESGTVRGQIDALARRAYADRLAGAARALPMADEALRLARETEYRPGEARALRAAAALRVRLLDLDRALAEATEAAEIFERLGDMSEFAFSRTVLGTVYRRRGDCTEALRHHYAALDLQEQLADLAGEAETRNNLAAVLVDTGDLARALEQLRASLALCERLDDAYGAAHVRLNIGAVLGTLGEVRDALEVHQHALDFFMDRQELATAAVAENNLGIGHARLGHYALALAHYQAARDLARGVGDREIEVGVLVNLAELRSDHGDSAGALELFRQVLAMTQAHDLPIQRADAYLGIGQTLAREGQPTEALPYLREALAISAVRGPQRQRAEVHHILSDAYEATNQVGLALRHFKEYHVLHDHVRAVEAERRLARAMIDAERRGRQRE